MVAAGLTLDSADASHTAAIVAIERAIPGTSIIALTNGLAVEEALARGHDVFVALDDDTVVGWVWCSIEVGRGGAAIGQLSRIAVASAHRRRGVGRALVEHADARLRERGATALRLSVDATAPAAIAFFESLGYAPSIITMERAL